MTNKFNPPPQNARRNPNKSAEQIGGPVFWQNGFRGTRISVPGPKHTFGLGILQVEACGNPESLSRGHYPQSPLHYNAGRRRAPEQCRQAFRSPKIRAPKTAQINTFVR